MIAASERIRGSFPVDWNHWSNFAISSSTSFSVATLSSRVAVGTMFIRIATPEMAEEISALDEALFDNGFNERTIRREIESGGGWVIGDPIVGYALTQRDRDLLDLTRLGVAPDTQGKGFGSKLLQAVIEQHPKVFLTVKKNNRVAIRLYQRHGFRIIGQHSDAPAWLMITS
jgi:ribosomal protein S18 acetylase RimI-like enzyme